MPKLSNKQKSLPAFDLKAEREKREMSQEQTAEFLFQSQGTISRWEINGKTSELAREYWRLRWQIADTETAAKSPKGKPKKD